MKAMSISAALAFFLSLSIVALSGPIETSAGSISNALAGDPAQPADGMERRFGCGHFTSDGLAFSNQGIAPLRLHLIDGVGIQPSLARSLLSERRTIEEIRDEISRMGGTPVARGWIMLGEDHYLLCNINRYLDERGSRLEADLRRSAGIDALRSGEVVGHIEIRSRADEGKWMGEGDISLRRGNGEIHYRIVLISGPPPIDCNGGWQAERIGDSPPRGQRMEEIGLLRRHIMGGHAPIW